MQSASEINNIIKKWLNAVFLEDAIPINVIALTFHIQRTHDEFVVYLTGHDDFYYDHDTWLLGEVYEPKENYNGLGIDSIRLSDREMYNLYKNEVYEFIKVNKDKYPENIHYFTCRYPVGMPELLFEK